MGEDTEIYIINCFIVGFLFLSALLNTLGIYLLKQCRSYGEQRLILACASSCILTISVLEIVYWCGELNGLVEESSRFLQCIIIVDLGIFSAYYITIFVLTLYRLIVFIYPYNYREILSQRIVLRVLAACWIAGILSSTPFFFLDYDQIYKVYYKYNFLFLDGLIIVTALGVYSFILFRVLKETRKLLKSRNTTAANLAEFHKLQHRNLKLFTVVFVIVATFILLVAIPDIVFVIRHVIYGHWENPIHEHIIYLVWEINYIIDPLIYIVFQKEVRNVLKKKVKMILKLSPLQVLSSTHKNMSCVIVINGQGKRSSSLATERRGSGKADETTVSNTEIVA